MIKKMRVLIVAEVMLVRTNFEGASQNFNLVFAADISVYRSLEAQLWRFSTKTPCEGH